jgi:hypothetical protein
MEGGQIVNSDIGGVSSSMPQCAIVAGASEKLPSRGCFSTPGVSPFRRKGVNAPPRTRHRTNVRRHLGLAIARPLAMRGQTHRLIVTPVQAGTIDIRPGLEGSRRLPLHGKVL